MKAKQSVGAPRKYRKEKERKLKRERRKKLKEKKKRLTCVRPCQFVSREKFFFLWKTYTLCPQGRNQDHFLQDKRS